MDCGWLNHWLLDVDHSSRKPVRDPSSPAGGVGKLRRALGTQVPHRLLSSPPLHSPLRMPQQRFPLQQVSSPSPAPEGERIQFTRSRPVRAPVPSRFTSKARRTRSRARLRYAQTSSPPYSQANAPPPLRVWGGYYPNQHQRPPHPEPSPHYRAVDPEVAYQHHTQFTNIDFMSATNNPLSLQEHRQPLAIPFVLPPSSSPVCVIALPLPALRPPLICILQPDPDLP